MSSFHLDVNNVINPEILCDSNEIKPFLRRLCKVLDLKIIEMFGREFSVDKGKLKGTKAYTFCVVLGTSSLCYHTYPECNSCQIDLVSCVPLENKWLDMWSVLTTFIKTENGRDDFIINHLKRKEFLIKVE